MTTNIAVAAQIAHPWWDLVDNDKVYEAISDDLFQAYVRLMTAIA